MESASAQVGVTARRSSDTLTASADLLLGDWKKAAVQAEGLADTFRDYSAEMNRQTEQTAVQAESLAAMLLRHTEDLRAAAGDALASLEETGTGFATQSDRLTTTAREAGARLTEASDALHLQTRDLLSLSEQSATQLDSVGESLRLRGGELTDLVQGNIASLYQTVQDFHEQGEGLGQSAEQMASRIDTASTSLATRRASCRAASTSSWPAPVSRPRASTNTWPARRRFVRGGATIPGCRRRHAPGDRAENARQRRTGRRQPRGAAGNLRRATNRLEAGARRRRRAERTRCASYCSNKRTSCLATSERTIARSAAVGETFRDHTFHLREWRGKPREQAETIGDGAAMPIRELNGAAETLSSLTDTIGTPFKPARPRSVPRPNVP